MTAHIEFSRARPGRDTCRTGRVRIRRSGGRAAQRSGSPPALSDQVRCGRAGAIRPARNGPCRLPSRHGRQRMGRSTSRRDAGAASHAPRQCSGLSAGAAARWGLP